MPGTLGKPKMTKMAKHEAIWGICLILPGFIGVMIFTAIPLGVAFILSLTDWNVATAPKFLGLANFREFFGDAVAKREFFNTFYYAVGSVPVSIIISLIVATLLNSKIRALTLYRTIYYLPNICMAVAITQVWQWILNSRFGLVNQIFEKFGLPAIPWMTDVKLIMPVIIFISVWSSIGYNMIILLASLQNISTTYYEAASIDGAGSIRSFFKITVPLMSPTVFFLSIIGFIGSFKAFDVFFVITGGGYSGGPLALATRTVVYGIYERGLVFLRFGYASAEAVILFFLIMLITGIQFLAEKKWVYYE